MHRQCKMFYIVSTIQPVMCVTLKVVIYDKRKINIFNDFTIRTN